MKQISGLNSAKIVALILLMLSGCKNQPEKEIAVNTKIPPNIVLINVDDLGWMDTEPYGTTFYQTPNISRLSDMGMTFSRGYAGAANCAPSRACLLSGMNTPRHGIYTVGNADRGNKKTRKLVPVPNTTVLHDSVVSLAEMLADVGYTSGSFGKWHLGQDSRTQGFDVNFGGEERGAPGKNGYFAPYNLSDPKLKNAPEGENLTDRLTTEAIGFMKSVENQPFFAYLTYYAVHTPLGTTPELQAKYERLGNSLQNNTKFAGMVETVDTNVGRIIDYLESESLLENTLIIFTSDNGGIRDISSQHPLRAGKGSYYEGGIRVPFIFVWKGQIAPGSGANQIISNLDIYPTLKEISGSALGNEISDGQSILPLLKGGEVFEKDLYFHFPIYLQAYNRKTDDGRDPLFRTRPGSVLVSGDWKLHYYYEDNTLELYNLKEDIGERTNLAESNPKKAKELHSRLQNWINRNEAPIPTEPNPDYVEGFIPKKK